MSYNTIQRMLSNRRYIGELRLRDVVQPNAIPALVSGELVGARPLHLACARPLCRLKAPLGLSLLRNRGILISEENKNPNPSPIEKRFGFSLFGAPPGTRTLGPLIKRNQRATIVNFQNYADSLFLSLYRKFVFCICCILCTCCPLSHPLSSRSGVQKVCKSVQSPRK